MKTLVSQSLKLSVACNILLAVVTGNGVHLHVLMNHTHDGGPVHQHDVVVHAHEDGAEPLAPTLLDDPSTHRHFVAKLQITGVQQSSQYGSPSVVQFEPWTIPMSTKMPAIDTHRLIICTHSSSPPRQTFTETLPGRSPPLA